MELDEALDHLPVPYARFLRWRAAGLDDATIATRLGVPCEALPSFSMIAEAKLARVMAAAEEPAEA